MATKPTVSTEWATTLVANGLNNTNNKIPSTASQKLAGFGFPEPPPRNILNYFMGSTHEWKDYFEQATDELGVAGVALAALVALTAAALAANSSIDAGTYKSYTDAAQAITDGYILANFQEVSRTGEANLFAAISTLFGKGNGTSTFNVPNLPPVLEPSTGWTDDYFPLAKTGDGSLTSNPDVDHVNDFMWYLGNGTTVKRYNLSTLPSTTTDYNYGAIWGQPTHLTVDTFNTRVFVSTKSSIENNQDIIQALDYGASETVFSNLVDTSTATGVGVERVLTMMADKSTGDLYCILELTTAAISGGRDQYEIWYGTGNGAASWTFLAVMPGGASVNPEQVHLAIDVATDQIIVSDDGLKITYMSALTSISFTSVAWNFGVNTFIRAIHIDPNNSQHIVFVTDAAIGYVYIWDGTAYQLSTTITSGTNPLYWGAVLSYIGDHYLVDPYENSSLGTEQFYKMTAVSNSNPGIFWYIKT